VPDDLLRQVPWQLALLVEQLPDLLDGVMLRLRIRAILNIDLDQDLLARIDLGEDSLGKIEAHVERIAVVEDRNALAKHDLVEEQEKAADIVCDRAPFCVRPLARRPAAAEKYFAIPHDEGVDNDISWLDQLPVRLARDHELAGYLASSRHRQSLRSGSRVTAIVRPAAVAVKCGLPVPVPRVDQAAREAGARSWWRVQPRPAGSSGRVAVVKISAARR